MNLTMTPMQKTKMAARWLLITLLPVAMFSCWANTKPSEEAAEQAAGRFGQDAVHPKSANP